MATFLQGQRRPLRGYIGLPCVREGIETSTEACRTPSSTKFCSRCRGISSKLEEILDRGFGDAGRISPVIGRAVTAQGAQLKHVTRPFGRKTCNLCNFLAHMVKACTRHASASYHSRGSHLQSLIVGSAKSLYGIPKDFSEVSESFCLWINLPGLANSVGTMIALPYGRPFDNELYENCMDGIALELANDSSKIGGRLVGAQANFELLRSWFDDCATHHGDTCQTDASMVNNIPGFRVIDCSSRRLVSWSELSRTQDPDYVALSYVWGTEPNSNEGKAFWPTWVRNIVQPNSDSTADGRLPSNLPQLIEDAIIAVVKLRFRYLWVDRYCIPQDNQQEKHTQIQNMDRIYGSASLTIIAAAGDDPSYGLPGVSPRYGRFQQSISTSVRTGSRIFVTVGTDNVPRKLKESKWYSRAWTMQEAFLSCRCLVFLDDGAYFQCCSPRSHRFEAIHEPPGLLKFRHEVMSQPGHTNTVLQDSIMLTKVGRRVGDSEFGWCQQLVKDYFPRSMSFEEDTLNAFSGILQYLQSLKPPIHSLWGILMFPNPTSMVSGQWLGYNLVYGLTWRYAPDWCHATWPRKGLFPSWSWLDWRSRGSMNPTSAIDENFSWSYDLELPDQQSAFTSLVDLSVELHDGRIVSWGKGYESDILGLTTSPQPPRVLHIQGYTANPELRYMTEEDWVECNERTISPTKEAHGGNGRNPKDHFQVCSKYGHRYEGDGRRWIFLDADGQHLQLPLEPTRRESPWCWGFRDIRYDFDVMAAYHLHRQRGNQDETTKPYTESTFDFRVILLGYNRRHAFYMLLRRTNEGTEIQTETFERVNVLRRIDLSSFGHTELCTEPAKMEEFLAKLTGKHAESFRGTPWTKMNTRVA